MPVKVFTALVVVDVQNDFLENGALGVPKASEVIDPINRMAQTFERVIVTQDWHCADHVSFAAIRFNCLTVSKFFGRLTVSRVQAEPIWPRAFACRCLA